jgi:hypothetical protein
MKRLLGLLLLSAICAPAQVKSPVAAVFTDRDGTAWRVEGVGSALRAEPQGEFDVESIALVAGRVLLKRADTVELLGEPHCVWPIPQGGVVVSAATNSVYQPSTGRLWRIEWVDGCRLNEAAAPVMDGELLAFGPSADGGVQWVVQRVDMLWRITGSSEEPLPGMRAPILVKDDGSLMEIPAVLEAGSAILAEDGYALLLRGESRFLWKPGAEAALVPMAGEESLCLYQRAADQSETLIGDVAEFPMTAAGAASQLRFRVRNAGLASVTVIRLWIEGQRFELFNEFSVPRVIAPGGFADFSIRYSPPVWGSYRATLRLNDRNVELRGAAFAAPSLEVFEGDGWRALTSGAVYLFGTVEPGQTADRRFRVKPPDGANTAPEAPRLAGAAFRLLPGAEAFTVTFAPTSAGTHEAKLDIGPLSYTLRGIAPEAVPPRLSLAAPATLDYARQERIRIRLEGPSRVTVSGVLRLEFTPENGLPDDPSVALLPNLTRSVFFQLKEGSPDVSFNGEDSVMVQTGTTAGTLRLRAQLGTQSQELAFRLEPSTVRIETARALLAANSAEVTIKGFDAVRTTTSVAFTFFRKDGQTAPPGRIERDVAGAFGEYFKANLNAGGTFQLKAHFPVSGASTELADVEVEIRNTAGVTRTERLRFE